MDEVEQLARDQAIYWAISERARLGPIDDTWPGKIEEARGMVDQIARGLLEAEREQLAALMVARARWAWKQFRHLR